MAWEASRISQVLYNNSNVTDLLSTFVAEDTNTYFCIFDNEVVPEEYKKDSYPKTINFYRNSPIDGGLNYGDVIYFIQRVL